MKPTYCEHTGLLYLDGVAFTKERVKEVIDIITLSNNNKGQFEYSLTIKDTMNNENKITIDKNNYSEFIDIIIHYVNIAEDKDFE